ncbi:MAG: RecX family transcriptional regulator, partial [Bacilli bacterium]|nr:RecX family transcriptional regulator [Bacilli bacterium]
KITTDKGEYKLYDDIIVKHELLLKKEIDEKDFQKIVDENNLFKAYYVGLKAISVKMRCEKEIKDILKKKQYNNKEIDYAIERLSKDGYLKHDVYIEAYVHDMLSLYLVGETKILNDLVKLGFKENEIRPILEKIDIDIYLNKIEKYINKKAKVNRKSVNDFKRKIMADLINKGFNKGDIAIFLDNLEMEENMQEVEKIVAKLYRKYINKYDVNTTKMKIKNYLYQKGYTGIDVDKYIDIS